MERLEKFYSISELVELLGVSASSIYRSINEGKLKRTKIGKLARFKHSDVEAYLQAVGNKPVYCPATGKTH